MYAVEVEYGNGYSCSCCRSIYKETEHFETLKEAEKFVADLKFKDKHYKKLKELDLDYIQDNDFYISDFYQIEDRPSENSESIQEMIKELEAGLDEKIAKKKKKEQRAKAARKRAAEKKKREQYEKLKAEFEGVES